VDIGDVASEAGRALESRGWGPVVGQDVPGSGNWGGENHCRVIWEAGSPALDVLWGRSATISMDFGDAPVEKLVMLRWLDGFANDGHTQLAHDSFRMTIAGRPTVYTLQDVTVGHPETWYDLCGWEVGELCGIHEITLTATGGEWAGFNTYGQVAFSEMATMAVCEGGSGPASLRADATLKLAGVTGPVNRCVRFLACNETECAAPVDVDVFFTGTPALGTVTFDLEEGDWTRLCAKDEQHALGAASNLILSQGTLYADSILVLQGGDTDNNDLVDIDDVTWLIATFGEYADGGTHPWDGARDADFSDDGFIGGEDYTFLAANWLQSGGFDCGCTRGAARDERTLIRDKQTPVGTPRTSTPAARLASWVVNKADLNADGIIDVKDVRDFEELHGLPAELSGEMRRGSTAKRAGENPARR
jgi:hypothetical protein